MNSQWNTFLQSQPAGIGRDVTANEGKNSSLPECALTDLSHLGLISVHGEDAETFLQGQVTNDVRNLTGNHFHISACCNPKGRMLASFFAFRHQQEIVLQMPKDTQHILLKRLPMFILRSRVTVTDAGDRLVCIGLIGDSAQTLLHNQFGQVPAKAWDAVQIDGFTLLRHPGQTPRIAVIGETAEMIALWKTLAGSAEPCGSGRWTLENIRAGIPMLNASTTESFLPQMTNMHLINGVSFTKGCYTGQEVVARTRYLGKIKRRMYLARIDRDPCPMSGDELFSAMSESGQGAGMVVEAQSAENGGCDILAVVEIASHDDGDVRIGSVNGEKLSFQTLPYSFDQE